MTRLTLRSLASRKLRTALTAMAIVLGVAMISGTYVLTDTIDRAFGDIFQQAAEGVDVSVTPRQAVDSPNADAQVPLAGALLDRVRAVDGVADARGDVFRNVTVVGADGEPLSTGGVPTFVASVREDRFEPFNAAEGRLPTADGEIAVDKDTAEDEGYRLGQALGVLGEQGVKRYRLVGIARYGSVDSLAGATVVLMTQRAAQVATDTVGRFDELLVAGEPGVAPAQLRDRERGALRGEGERGGLPDAGAGAGHERDAAGEAGGGGGGAWGGGGHAGAPGCVGGRDVGVVPRGEVDG